MENPFLMKESCVYLTTYYGKKMSQFYIGSSYSYKVDNHKYYGSVSSKKWKAIWYSEIMNNPHLFESEILMRFSNRQAATDMEEIIQKKLDVVKSNLFINESFANKGFGYNIKHSDESKKLMSINSSGYKASEETRLKITKSKTGSNHSEETKNKMSEIRKGIPQQIVDCPFCDKTGEYLQ